MTISSKETPLTKFYQLELGHSSAASGQCNLSGHIDSQVAQILRAHIRNTTNKCSCRLGFLRRNLKRCPKKLKKTVYISLVRSCAEYGAAIWGLHLAKGVKALERIQNRAIRWVSGIGPREPTSISQLRQNLKWPTLEKRRQNIRLTYMYKIIHKDIELCAPWTPWDAAGWLSHQSQAQVQDEGTSSHCWRSQTLLRQPHNSTVELFPRLSGGGQFCSCLQESAGGAAWLSNHRPLV